MRMMETLKRTLILILLLVVHSRLHIIKAQNPDQSGFISLDCGLPGGSPSYTEETTELNYVSDAPFIATGLSKRVLPEHGSDYQQQMIHLRSFPEGVRNCYEINVEKGTKYLIMTSFLYGNYDKKGEVPSFDVHIGRSFWETISLRSDYARSSSSEIIHTPPRDYLHLCLVNTGFGTPFINAVELRPLLNTTYVSKDSIALSLVERLDLGLTNTRPYRYPQDVYDRTWLPFNEIFWKELGIKETVVRKKDDDYWLPTKLMQTAAIPINESIRAIEIYVETSFPNKRFHLYAHFAELQELKPDEYRAINIRVNGEVLHGPIVPQYLSSTTVYNTKPFTGYGNYNFSFDRFRNSTLPPILNAYELYFELDFSLSETDEDDVKAMNSIKSTYGVERDWNGDPCVPKEYSWGGINCSFNDSPRVTSLNLSFSGLTGSITVDISKLTMLQSLDLSNNGLTGLVPDFSTLPHLTVLNLRGNNLTGSLPSKLIEKSKNGLLILRYDENKKSSCDSYPCNGKNSRKKNDILMPIALSVGGLVFLFIAAAIFLFCRKKHNHGATAVNNEDSEIEALGPRNKQFTYEDVLKMTNNLERILGKGGFGIVYYGVLDNTIPVAVKMLSASSAQGFNEFQAEVKLLATVHHRNLTSLVGYCSEETNKALIYEYMPNGNLETCLSSGDTITLSWERRLKIAIDVAQGLEYLHRGCKPPIVHRDVKTSNILLTENFHAKISDFGLCKVFPTDGGSHVTTIVAGTPGYLDPEYYSTNRLNEKSDVYSFGVVLLQIITCRHAFISTSSNDRTHISNWVTSIVNNGDIQGIVDPRLVGDYDINSVWKAVDISMACLFSSASNRPNMNEVVSELNECLSTELARKSVRILDSGQVITVNLDTDINPLAR